MLWEQCHSKSQSQILAEKAGAKPTDSQPPEHTREGSPPKAPEQETTAEKIARWQRERVRSSEEDQVATFCSKCGAEIAQDAASTHRAVCPMSHEPCPHCAQPVLRAQLQAHVLTCEKMRAAVVAAAAVGAAGAAEVYQAALRAVQTSTSGTAVAPPRLRLFNGSYVAITSQPLRLGRKHVAEAFRILLLQRTHLM